MDKPITLDLPRLLEQIEEATLAARAADLRAESRRREWASAEAARVGAYEELVILKRLLDDLTGPEVLP
jgi:hypothetical protein